MSDSMRPRRDSHEIPARKLVLLDDAIGAVQGAMSGMGRGDVLADGELLRDYLDRMAKNICKELDEAAHA